MCIDPRLSGKAIDKISNLWNEHKTLDEKIDHLETDGKETYQAETKMPCLNETKNPQVKERPEVSTKPVTRAPIAESRVEPISLEILKPPLPSRKAKPQAISAPEKKKSKGAISAIGKKKHKGDAFWVKQMQCDQRLSPHVRLQILNLYRKDKRFSRKRKRPTDWVKVMQNDSNLSSAARKNILLAYDDDQKYRKRYLLTINQSKHSESAPKRFKIADKSQYENLTGKSRDINIETAGSTVGAGSSLGSVKKEVYSSEDRANSAMDSKPKKYSKPELRRGRPIGYRNSLRSGKASK